MSARQTSREPGESLPREVRLRRRVEFQRCYRQGRRRQGALMVLYAVPSQVLASHSRLGVTVSRKVGGAVVRSRTKRRIREIYRRWSERSSLAAVDLVVHAKPAAGQAEYGALEVELTRLLRSFLAAKKRGS